MTLRYLSVECQTLTPKKPPHTPRLILPEKMLTPLYLPPSRLRRATSACTISKVSGEMMAVWLCSTK